MVCVPSRGAFSWVQLPRRRVHALRCPRSCRLARPSGRRCLPGPSSGRGDFQPRLRSRRFPRFSVPSQGGAGSSLGIHNLSWSRPSSGASPRRGSGLVPLGSAKHLPASHDAGFTALHPLSGSGKAVRLSYRSAGWIPCPVLGAFCFSDGPGVSPSRSAGPDSRPLRDGFAATPSPRDGELPSDVPRKGNGVGRGGTSIGVSGFGYAAGAGFPPFRWPDQLSSGRNGILRSLASRPVPRGSVPAFPYCSFAFALVLVVVSVRRVGFSVAVYRFGDFHSGRSWRCLQTYRMRR